MAPVRYLPEDMITEILYRLPVNSLLNFKSVSKPWRRLIKTNKFVLNYFRRNKKLPHLIFDQNPRHDNNDNLVPSRGIRKLFPQSIYYDLRIYYDRLTELNGPSIKFFGPVNGFFVLLAGKLCKWSLDQCMARWKRMALWNPSTRQLRPLLQFQIPHDLEETFQSSSIFGFGLDLLKDQFKVVWIHPWDYIFSASVLSESTESWKHLAYNCIKGIDINRYTNGFQYHSIYVNGNNYWLSEDSVSILVFNMGTEVFREMNTPLLPPYSHEDKETQIYESDSQLGFAVLPKKIWESVDMWQLIMKDDGKSYDWCKHVIVTSQFLQIHSPLGSANIDDDREHLILITTTSLLAIYDPKTGDVGYVGGKFTHTSLNAYCYKENLFSVGFQISDHRFLDFVTLRTSWSEVMADRFPNRKSYKLDLSNVDLKVRKLKSLK